MKLYHKNPRTISKKQFSQLEEWLRELGDLSGVVHDLNTDEIVGGNQRSRVFDIDKCQVEITQQLDAPDEQGTVALGFIVWEGKRYSYRQVRWTEKQCEKANIVANKGGGDWEWDTLANDFDMGDLLEWGFTEKELTGCDFGPQGEADAEPQIDKAAELQQKWQTETGQLWRIGEHRLLCGDSTKREDVERLMAGEKAALCLTDPPYATGGKSGDYDIDPEELQGLIDAFLPIALEQSERALLTPGNAFMFRYPSPDWVLAWFVAAGTGVNPWGFTFWNAILAYGKDPYLQSGKGSRPDAFVKTEAAEKTGHPTSKPLGVWSWILERGSVKRGEVVFDPFCGSGTTMVACENLGRKCRAIEIAPGYVAVILQRMQDAFGITGELVTQDVAR